MSAGQIVLRRGVRRRVVRGVLLSLALIYVGILLVAPTVGILWTVLQDGTQMIFDTFALQDVQNAFKLTATITVITVVVTAFFGVITAWVLARDNFPGRSILNAFVDLPMAVSPVIVGLMAVLLFGRGGWFEPFFAAQGIQIIFAVPSMVIVTIFISIPFVIREVTPVLQEIGTDEEEAAKTLGASSLQSFFRVTLPNIKWALCYGIALVGGPSPGRDRCGADRFRLAPGHERVRHTLDPQGDRRTSGLAGVRRRAHARSRIHLAAGLHRALQTPPHESDLEMRLRVVPDAVAIDGEETSRPCGPAGTEGKRT